MNLQNVVSGVISAVNPQIAGQMFVSTGYTTDDSGSRTPTYATPIPVSVQLQPLSYKGLQQTDGLNLTGIVKEAYVNGNFEGVNRGAQKGGDLLVIGTETWLIVQPLEEWHDWCRFIVNLQVDTP
jgi:hypothetical protein